ncbi:hypothetical protein HID58_095024 [Brassica napus]|uniref:RRM domain-containing protein n=1 Tax=Brassica napus TaxID=3708 RepID=A0ABQ7X524_BRANA|nr:hypothetical protein HID58_095024 [Brassica napus]
MQSDNGKLFIGGISWDTNEERLKEYFSTFGEVIEAVILKDRTTGRARGFGFVVFADPAVAEFVITEKHHIDGRLVEAKKAVPRDDQNMVTRSNSSSIQGSPDVVVMYDHNTQRPRGFGFITYDTEEAVDKVLLKTFHELNGKMVEVKRAVPKEMSPGPARSPLGAGYSYGVNRSVGAGRSVFANFGSGYGMNMNFDQGLPTGSLEFGYGGNGESGFGYAARSIGPSKAAPSSSFSSASAGYDGAGLAEFYGNGAVYSDPTWRSPTPEAEGPASFSYGIGGGPSSDVSARSSSPGYVGSYKRQPNRGEAPSR